MPDSPPPPQVWPTLRATHARTLIDFLVDAFGFEVVVLYGEGDRVDHAQLAWPLGGGIMLGSARDPETDEWAPTPGTFGAYVVADDIEALFARAIAAGATAIRAPQETEYGSVECAVHDIEGNYWSFGTYRGA